MTAPSVEPTPQELALKAIEYLQSPAGIAAMRKSARDNARGKIWALEGYALRSKLAA